MNDSYDWACGVDEATLAKRAEGGYIVCDYGKFPTLTAVVEHHPQTPMQITVDKTQYRIRYEDETESQVTIVI